MENKKSHLQNKQLRKVIGIEFPIALSSLKCFIEIASYFLRVGMLFLFVNMTVYVRQSLLCIVIYYGKLSITHQILQLLPLGKIDSIYISCCHIQNMS